MGHEVAFLRMVIAAVLMTAAIARRVEDRRPLPSAAARTAVMRRAALRIAEIVVSLALLSGPGARWGLLGAALLAAGVLVTLVVSMSRGASESYGGFGALDRNLSPLVSTFRASVLFAIAAGGLAWSWNQPNPHVWLWLGSLDTARQIRAILGLTAVAVAFAVPGRITLALSDLNDRLWGVPAPAQGTVRPSSAGFHPAGLPIGSAAPGWAQLFEGERGEQSVLLLFVRATPAPDDARVSEPACTGVPSIRIPVSGASSLADQYRVRALPSALLVSGHGVVRSHLAVGPRAIGVLWSPATDATRTRGAREGPNLSAAAVVGGCAKCGS